MSWLVGEPEAQEVEGKHLRPGCLDMRQDQSPVVGAGRVPVQQDDELAGSGAASHEDAVTADVLEAAARFPGSDPIDHCAIAAISRAHRAVICAADSRGCSTHHITSASTSPIHTALRADASS